MCSAACRGLRLPPSAARHPAPGGRRERWQGKGGGLQLGLLCSGSPAPLQTAASWWPSCLRSAPGCSAPIALSMQTVAQQTAAEGAAEELLGVCEPPALPLSCTPPISPLPRPGRPPSAPPARSAHLISRGSTRTFLRFPRFCAPEDACGKTCAGSPRGSLGSVRMVAERGRRSGASATTQHGTRSTAPVRMAAHTWRR